jgi:hypothetical protein
MIIGIDPGLSGAICWRWGSQEECGSHPSIGVCDAPVFRPLKGTATINAQEVTRLLRDFTSIGAHCFIERAQAMPDQGSSSGFNYGTGFGIYIGVLAALDIPYTFVGAAVWKRHHGLIKQDKEASRLKATVLVPQLAGDLRLKKHHGRAEAVLIALYGAAKMEHSTRAA